MSSLLLLGDRAGCDYTHETLALGSQISRMGASSGIPSWRVRGAGTQS